MARIATITKKEELAPEGQKVFDAIAQSRGVVGGPWLALLHSPEMAYRTMHLGSFVRFESSLDHKVIEFTAPAAGSYQWFCIPHSSVNGATRQGMVGTLQVQIQQP